MPPQRPQIFQRCLDDYQLVLPVPVTVQILGVLRDLFEYLDNRVVKYAGVARLERDEVRRDTRKRVEQPRVILP